MLALLERRRSVPPAFLAEPGPSPDQLDRLLRIAARVPDHGKLAPWRFIVFAGEGRARAGAVLAGLVQADNPAASPEKLAMEQGRLVQAPVVVGLVSRVAPHAKIPEWEQLMSVGAAGMALTVAATAMGFATSWLTEWPAYDTRAKAALGLAETENLAGFFYIGTPTMQPQDRLRPVMADVVTRF